MNAPDQGRHAGWVGVEGIGFWAGGLPSWHDARQYSTTGESPAPASAAARPAPRLLEPNERRRAPETVALALEVALAACEAAGRDPATLPSVFASTHGDLAVTDYMCATLARDPGSVSPIKFHNSVHNAAAGYWTIGVGAMAPATALSAYDASFAQGLIEALSTLAAGAPAVLLVAYDSQAVGPLASIWNSAGLLGGALLLTGNPGATGLRLRAALGTSGDSGAHAPVGALQSRYAGNAMAPMLALFDALASDTRDALLHAGPRQRLHVEIARG